jgi:hypothetical protein
MNEKDMDCTIFIIQIRLDFPHWSMYPSRMAENIKILKAGSNLDVCTRLRTPCENA